MEALKKYIEDKSNKTSYKSKILAKNQNKKSEFVDDQNKDIYLKNKNIIDRLERFFEIERLADNYKNKIRKYFFSLFEYISKNKDKNFNEKNNGNCTNRSENANSNKIDISAVVSFVNESFKNYKVET